MRGKLIHDISASTAQVVLNQCLGLLIFYICSRYLPKELFGELNWGLATAALLIAITGLGIDTIIIKRIARGDDSRETIGLHFIHVLFMGTLFSVIICLLYWLLPSQYSNSILLPCIFISQAIGSFASPFRQLANGNRSFRHLAIIATISPLIKGLLLIICVMTDRLTVQNIAFILVLGSVLEFMTGLLITLFKKQVSLFPLFWNTKKYLSLIKESTPQYGVSLFNIVVARFDWIMLGLLTTTIITAEYSFAYKVFELSRLPLLIISPILIPVFIKIFNTNGALSTKTQLKLDLLFQVEMLISVLLPVALISCWSPLMDLITDGKYGRVNEITFMLLSVCVPLQFATDYYWNLCFAQDQLKLTFLVSVSSGIINIALNLALVPFFGAVGAAIAYLCCFVVQLLLFKLYTRQDRIKPNLLILAKTVLSASAALWITRYVTQHILIAPAIALTLYLLFSMLTQVMIPQKIRPALRLFTMR